jgi:hypothetical protein
MRNPRCVTRTIAVPSHRHRPFTRWIALDSVAPDTLSCGPRQLPCGCWRLENFRCSLLRLLYRYVTNYYF